MSTPERDLMEYEKEQDKEAIIEEYYDQIMEALTTDIRDTIDHFSLEMDSLEVATRKSRSELIKEMLEEIGPEI